MKPYLFWLLFVLTVPQSSTQTPTPDPPCYQTDEKQPFRFDVCFEREKPVSFSDVVIAVRIPPTAPAIRSVGIVEKNAKVGIIGGNFPAINPKPGAGGQITYKIAVVFNKQAEKLQSLPELNFVVTATSVENLTSTFDNLRIKLQH